MSKRMSLLFMMVLLANSAVFLILPMSMKLPTSLAIISYVFGVLDMFLVVLLDALIDMGIIQKWIYDRFGQ
ncbi:MAG: hypothetical protein QW478_06445 [Candidatus Micrarchaeaceae archaeon]